MIRHNPVTPFSTVGSANPNSPAFIFMPGGIFKVDKSKSMGAAILEWLDQNKDREPTAYDLAMRKIKGIDPTTDEARACAQERLRKARAERMKQ